MFSRPDDRTKECDGVKALLPALPDGALAPAEDALVRTHLARCSACAREAALLSELGTLLRRDPLPLSQVPLPTGEQMAHSIIEAERVDRRRRTWPVFTPPRLFGMTAGLAAAVALAVVLTRPPQAPVTPTAPAIAQPAAATGFWIEDDERTGRDVIVAPATGLDRGG